MNDSPNGKSRLEQLEKIAADLLEAAQKNLDEHDKIWKSIETLRDSHLDTLAGIKQLTGSIRDLIDRIPPENLRQ